MILAVESAPVPARAKPTFDLRIDHPASTYSHASASQRDPRLDQVANDLASLPDPRHRPAVETALHARGVLEQASLIVVARDEASLDFGKSLAASNARVGIAGGGARPVVAIVIHTAQVELPELPRALAAGDTLPLHGALASWLHAPAITVTYEDDPDDVVHPVIWKTDRYQFDTAIECGAHLGAMWILIEASEDDTDEVRGLALFPISCGGPPEDLYRIEPHLDGDPVPALASVIDRERTRLGLRTLAGDLRATRAAQAQVALKSVKHGDAVTRMRDAGLIPLTMREATLHAPDTTAAAEILLNTPGYRELLALPELTHIGIAIARDAHGELYVAIELVQIVDPVDTDKITAELLARINAATIHEEPLLNDTTLRGLAVHYTRLRSAGWSDAMSYIGFTDDGDTNFGPYKAIHRALGLLLDGNSGKVDLDLPPHFDKLGTRVGISVVQSPRNGPLAGRVWVIILYGAQRRWDAQMKVHLN